MNNIIQTQNFSISPNSLIHSVNTSDFTCCICLNIFFDPIILKCCEKLLCITCLESYFHSNKTCLKCPYCNNKSLSFSLPPQLINRLFEGLRFKCPQCSSEINYYFYHEHIFNTCPQLPQTTNTKYCKHCHVLYSIVNAKEHNCKEYINTLLNDDNKTQIDKRIRDLKLKILGVEIPNKIISIDEEDGGYNIPLLHIHKLYHTNIRTRPEYEQGWLCELCSDDIKNPRNKSYHCEICTFDICEKCFMYISNRVPNVKCHNHDLFLEMRDYIWECSLCGEVYYKRHSWYCDICDFDACVFCFWKAKQ